MGFKLKGRTMFPALVSVTSPLTLVKNGLQYTFGVDPSQGAVGPTGPGYGGTSTTSLAIATGSKTFATQSGYAYQAGNYIRASSAADGTNYMEGTITSYVGTSLVVGVTKVGGSGTKTDWTFSLAGTPGANGAGSGDMLAANNLSDVGNKKTSLDNISVHGADVASATTTNLETATGDLVDVTGTTTITAITLNEGHERTVRFTGALTLTHGASLVLPGAASITTAAGDFAVFRGYAASVVRCVSYIPAAGVPLRAGSALATFVAAPSSANLRSALTDETGTGAAVFATSPAITTPVVTGITSGTPPTTGKVGEIIRVTVALASRVNLTVDTDAVWITLPLTAGIWLVGGTVGVYGSAGSATHMHASHGNGITAIATTPDSGTTALHLTTNNSNGWIFPYGVEAYNLSGSANINGVVQCTFSGGSWGAYGTLWGLRIA